MKILYHLGAHCTDEGAILRLLLRNSDRLAAQGTAIPLPEHYEAMLRAAAAAYAGQPQAPQQAKQLLQHLLPQNPPVPASRMVISFESLLAFPRGAITEEGLYPQAGHHAGGLASLFPDHQVEFCLALRNPATLVPALSAKRMAKGGTPIPSELNPLRLSWLDVVKRLRAACPEAEITLWADEDSPLIWHQILRHISAHAPDMPLEGVLDFPASLLRTPGERRMRAWFERETPTTDPQCQAGLADFLNRFGDPELTEMTLDMPGWDQDSVDRVTARYEAECQVLQTMPNVTVLRPVEV